MKDASKQSRVGEILHHLLESLRMTADFVTPFLPETAREIQSLLGVPEDGPTGQVPWGSFFQPDHQVKPPKVLFPRIETD